MSYVLWALVIYGLWSLAGIGWFVLRLGDKGKPKNALMWLADAVLLTPILPLAWLVGKMSNRHKR